MSAKPVHIRKALEVFVKGFTFTRSFSWPAEARTFGPLWVMRDQVRKYPKDYRTEEWIAWRASPAAVDRIARKHSRSRFWVCAIHAVGESDAPLREGYKALGYRLMTTEAIMAARLTKIPAFGPPAGIRIVRVSTPKLASKLAKAARQRFILPEHLKAGRATLRLYAAMKGNHPVGWMRSITVGTSAWTADVFVDRHFRRKGIGKALLSTALADDRRYGLTAAVLTASHAGALLYPALGYRTLGTLLIFTPPRR